ncbi:hypothetical protein DIPPA_03865 [Diplonema papillatum]|nr:hypothetical protein DIPPA_07700 [Diplonema papillatum]KAJ9450001.1 hypothetical protein DIPPA_07882 [Diplonema papillatum]KAJ9453593.1 hypothetical protein DIPPA_28740 [Diplonema papillatum]KAJ9462158.1 hypothetical protein DIPPA_05564 [Diplonema papillatum]KAJ9464043.1 hypothetical protein DIPPA_01026 [Diplonema papillatum]
MEEIQQYLAKAQLLAETAEDEAQYCTVFGIVKILLILSERMGRKHPTVRAEKAPKKEAKAEVKAEPRKTQANWKADAPAVRREGAWTTVPPKGGPKSAEAKPKQEMKSGWLKVATAGKEARRTTTADCGKKPDGEKKPVSRGKPALRAKDWELPLIDAKLLLDESEKKAKPEGVIEATMGEGRRVLQYADELTQLETEGVRLVIVTPRSIAEDSTRELVFREDGSVEYAHVTLRGAKTAKPSGGQVTLDGDASATRVLVFTALHRELTDEKVEILRSETKGAGATDTLCARSAKGAAVTIERRHRWRHARMSDRSTCMVRVPQAHAASLLGASGHEGLFWSAPRFVEGGESHKVQWLAEDATLEEALALTALPGTHGLVPARARLGVRYSAEGEQLEALREAAGMLLAPELPDEGVAYFVTGGRNEHAEDIVQALVRAGWVGRTRKTFSKKGRTRMVVTAQSPPPAEVLRRAGRDPLHIRELAHGDERRAEAKIWHGKVPRVTVPGEPQADEAVKEEHCHEWQEAARNKSETVCSVCDTTRQKGTMMRACACESKICAPCFAARKKAKQDEAV